MQHILQNQNNSMKRINVKYVTASEAGNYYQVSFYEEKDSLTNYFLIQWGFEFEDIVPDEPYIIWL